MVRWLSDSWVPRTGENECGACTARRLYMCCLITISRHLSLPICHGDLASDILPLLYKDGPESHYPVPPVSAIAKTLRYVN